MTKKKEKWYHPQVSDTGWKKDLPADERRMLMLKAHGGDVLASAKALQAVSNVTRDPVTKTLANSDADYFYKVYRRGRAMQLVTHGSPRITKRRKMRITEHAMRIS